MHQAHDMTIYIYTQATLPYPNLPYPSLPYPTLSTRKIGSCYAGMAFANAPVGAVHALAYPIGCFFCLVVCSCFLKLFGVFGCLTSVLVSFLQVVWCVYFMPTSYCYHLD